MGLCNSPDIFQEKMNELFVGFEDVRAYLDDCLLITSGTYEHHLERLLGQSPQQIAKRWT